MDYNQDFAINRLHVLDDTNVTCDKNACAIFNGGIYVEKDIHANNIHIRNLKNNNISAVFADISTANITTANISTTNITTGNFQTINIKNSICPTDTITNASIGSNDKKWNAVYSTNGNFQVINTNTANTKNLKYDNLITFASMQTIPSDFDIENDFIVQLDKDIIFINICEIYDYVDDCLVRIKIPESTVPYEHHKIVLNQPPGYKILWSIPGCLDFISGSISQVYEIINIPYIKWKVIKYSTNTNGYEEINCNEIMDVSCCDLEISGCCVNKTFIKYIYKYPNELSGEIDNIRNLVDNLSENVLTQADQINTLNSLTRKCELLNSNTMCLETKYENLHRKLDDIHKINNKADHKKIYDEIDDISRIVRRNDEKIKDIETRLTSMNSKMKKIIKYLNLD